MKCNPDDQAFPARNDANQRGLTKFEYISTRALQGIVAGHPGIEKGKAAEQALEYADELFRQMGK